MKQKAYIVAGNRPWNRDIFDRTISVFPGEWYFAGKPDELTTPRVVSIAPEMIFFLHWSQLVGPELFENYPCVCFHMTDLPYGRGGSPLQNLILAGHTETRLTALKMVRELDAGPVYMKRPLSLEGTAEEIYRRADELCMEMIRDLIRTDPEPVPQQGEPVFFQRRTPDQSRIDRSMNPQQLYDFIRMLDAEGYPRAFEHIGDYRLEYSGAKLTDRGLLSAEVNMTYAPKKTF